VVEKDQRWRKGVCVYTVREGKNRKLLDETDEDNNNNEKYNNDTHITIARCSHIYRLGGCDRCWLAVL